MLPKTVCPLLRVGAVFALLLTAIPSALLGQVNFYSAPPPSDIGNNIGRNEETEDSALPGLGIFAHKPFTLSLAVREGYDTNVFTTSNNRVESFYTNVAGGIDYGFGNSRLQLTSNLNGGVTYYYSRPGDKVDYNGTFSLNAVYLASERLTLTLNTSTAYLAQPDLSIVGGTNRENGDYLYSNTSISAAYQWSEKFSTVTAYNFSVTYYVDDELNQNQGHVDQTISQSARWLLLPKTTLIAEYRFNPVLYFDADLDTYNNFFLVGVDQVFNPRFTWSARAGLQVGFDNNPNDGSSTYVGPYAESTLTYQAGRSTSLNWNLRYGTEASGLNDVTQRQTFRTGLGLTQALTKRISLNLGVDYQNNFYDQSSVIDSFYENIFDASVALNFQIVRYASFQIGYQYTVDLAPASTGRNYDRNVAFIGANFGF
jgi:Putative beta-barrel porin 2